MDIHHVLEQHAARTPEALAVLSPGRVPLTYGRLRRHVDDVVQTLHTMGLGRHDRIALVLPNGPEMAVACLAVAAGATCAPLNPASSAHECDLSLADLHATTLIIQADMMSPARAVAQARGLCIIELSPALEAEAGLFTLAGEAHTRLAQHGLAQPEDTALLLLTSGTTSRPKIVPLTHTNVCTSAHDVCVALELVESDRCLNVMPLFHAHGLIATTLASLMAGASVVCTPGLDISTFFAWMTEFRPTWYSASPTIHQHILAHAAPHRDLIARCPLRFIRSSALALPPRVLVELERVFHAPVIEGYGMTEAAVQITCNPLPPRQRKIGSVGRAAGPEVVILDSEGTVLPAGEIGEIAIRGANVMQGYDNQPTASAFIHGWFRTGDQGFLDHHGYLFITGRLKEIINRGGENIAPREVDEVLMDHPAVAQAVTFAVPDPRLGEEVAAAVVLHQNTVATDRDIREFAAARLAAFKVPRWVCIVEDIPHSSTGKVQRSGLAEKLGLTASDRARSTPPADFGAPCTPGETVLAELWAQVLGLERVGRHDEFFHLGGDSILATQLMSRIREAMQVEVPFLAFFETPTVAEMAQWIETGSRVACGPPAMPHARASTTLPVLRPLPRDRALPLSFGQQRLWFLEQLEPGSAAANISRAFRLTGVLNVTALEQSLCAIGQRHEILRTTFPAVDGRPLQVIAASLPLTLQVVDLRALPETAREVAVRHQMAQEAQQPFDVAQGPLLRAKLLHLTNAEYVFLLTVHHMVFDGWSFSVLFRELTAFYTAYATGERLSLPALPIQYADFAVWQYAWLQGSVLQTQLTYWRQRLGDSLPVLELPTDRPRPPLRTSRGARQSLVLPTHLAEALKALSRREGSTLFMTLLAAFKTLLYRYTGQADLLVGTAVAGRNHVDTEELIGFFVNTLALRTDMGGDPSFRGLLGRVRNVVRGAYSHQELPFEKLVEELQPKRDLSRNPLFQVMFTLQHTPRSPLQLAGLTLRPLATDTGTAKFDLALSMTDADEQLIGSMEYNTDLFDVATISRMLGHLQTLLEGLVVHPEQPLSTLPLLPEAERHQMLVTWNNTPADYPAAACVHQLFEAQVKRTPDAVAALVADQQLTYGALNARANQVAHYLRKHGIGPEVRVGLCVERSLAILVGLLGILKAGGAYVPLDLAYPQESLAFILKDAQVAVLLCQQHLVASLPEHGAQVICLDIEDMAIAQESGENPGSEATANNLAYIMYTSGTTGQPKGVMIEHKSVINYLGWINECLLANRVQSLPMISKLIFDASLKQLFAPLLRGHTVWIVADDVVTQPAALLQEFCMRTRVGLNCVPSLWKAMLDAIDSGQASTPSESLVCVFVGGERLSQEIVDRSFAVLPHLQMWNLYGPTETTVQASVARITSGDHVTIGRPIANTQIYLLDSHLQPVPIGVPGEVYISGVGLARGYYNRAAFTAEKFVPHPWSDEPGARLYKTGDLARYLPDGHLEFLGRMDHQVKIRGYRIELGEIEAALQQHPAIRQAVVLDQGDAAGHLRLVAYLVADRAHMPTVSALRDFLKTRLPGYMIPAAYVMLDTLPRTPGGKVDRRALPPPDQARPELAGALVAPRTPTEEVLAGIWATLLGIEHIGVHDNFFELGGHSLLAVQVMSRVRDALHLEIPLHALFDVPTVAGLARHVDGARQAKHNVPAPAIMPSPRTGVAPVSVAQGQLWLLDQALPGMPFFNIPSAVRLTGALDVASLAQSFNEIIRRHDVLRTTFAIVGGRLVQVIAPTLHLPVTVQDLRALPASERDREVQRLVREESQQPFDLERGPLLQVRVLQLDEQEHIMLLTMHHIISDGWSMGVLTHELGVLYEAFSRRVPSPLPELPIQYADLVHWQRQWQQSETMQTQLAYWQQQLCDPLPVLALPTDRPRETIASLLTARQSLVLPRALSEAVLRLSRQQGSSLFMTLLAAFKMLLHGYTGQQDLRVGALVANRNRRETEGLIGLCLNTVLLRTDLGGNPSFLEVLRRVRATTLDAYAHQDLPFEELVRTLEHARGLQRASLCQVMFILQNATQQPLELPGLRLSVLEADESVEEPEVRPTTFDVSLMVRDRPQGLLVSCLYKPQLFEATTINRMLGTFQHVLESICSQPELALSTFDSLGGERRCGVPAP